MKKRAYIRPALLLHIVIWAVLFFSPLIFAGNGEKIKISRFLINSAVPVTLFIVFYANYLFLAPRYMAQGKKRYFWMANTVLIITFAVSLHNWFEYNRDKDIKAGIVKKEPRHKKDRRMLFMIRDIINLSIAATTATAIILSRKWTEAEQARKEAETAKTEAELCNLRNQINPHFLLNTLNNIYALTAFDKEKAQTAILELSNMLRHVLYENQQQYVSLTDEIKFIRNYIDLMKIRLTDNVDVTENINVPENCTIKIAPLIFISLIENAFKHGTSNSSKSFIHITIAADNKQITCCIENSNNPKPHTDHSGHGIGLQQVKKRLDLSYHDRYKWEKGVTENNTYISKITLRHDT